MSSTNKTTHYELSQYTASDKPSYLVDYNSDMAAIDSGIYAAKSEADTNTTNIGTLSNLTTTEKTNLVGAINEVDGDVSTLSGTVGDHTTAIATNTSAIGTLANLDTTYKADLVGAINEVNDKAEEIEKFNINTFNTYNQSSMSISDGSLSTSSITVASNTDYSVLKIYGKLFFGSNAVWYNIVTINNVIPAEYRPSSAITINPCGIAVDDVNKPFNEVYLVINTNGSIEIHINKQSNESMSMQAILIPFVIFLKDFGDQPA